MTGTGRDRERESREPGDQSMEPGDEISPVQNHESSTYTGTRVHRYAGSFGPGHWPATVGLRLREAGGRC